MNNVSQTRINRSYEVDKGAGKGVVLFFCVLFCLFQVFTALLSFSFRPNYPEKQLQVFSEESLGFVVVEDLNRDNSPVQLLSPDSYNFAPFFFQPVAINYCDKTMLMSVKGIGPGLADNILKTRDQLGSFTKPDDLLLVKGIGTARLHQFAPHFSFLSGHE